MKSLLTILMVFLTLPLCAEEIPVPIADNWYVEAHQQGSEAKIEVDKASASPVAMMHWDLGTGFWAQLVGRFPSDITKSDGISFWMKGDGENNRVTLKIEDKDASFFGADVPFTSNCPEWQEVRIPFTSFRWLWGGDYNFNKEGIQRIFIAVERSKGGKGTLMIKDMKFMTGTEPAATQTQTQTQQ
jgi:hypothetical protein